MRDRLFVLLLVAMTLAPQAAPAAGKYNNWEDWLSSANAVLPSGDRDSPFRTNLAVGGGLAPEYLGGDDYELKLLPLLETTYAGTVFLSTQQGLGYNFVRRRTVRAGPRLTLDFGRDASDSQDLRGLPDIDTSVEAGVFVEWFNGAWRFRGDLRQDISGGHEGFLANAEIAWGSRWSESASVVIGGKTTYMGDTYAESFFSVAAANPTTRLPAFGAAAGIRDVNGFVQIVFDITQTFYVSVEGRGQVLLGDAADSPISATDTAFTGAMLLGVRF